jgi:probable phosphoglycerate mutase
MPHSQTTRILAIRHGETAWNRDARIQGYLDIPLNEAGLRQAARLDEALADEDLHAVYSSDLSRARETARALAARRGLPLQLDEGLRERSFGVFEGRSFAELEVACPDETLRWRRRDPDFGPEGGERLDAFYARCVEVWSRIAATHPGQTIAIVSHGGVLDSLYRAATRVALQAPRTWSVANTSVNRLLYTDEGFTLVGWGDVQHLDGEVLDSGLAPALAPLDEGGDGGRAPQEVRR